VKARLLTTIGDDEAALAVIEPALDPKRPNERVVDLLAELKLKAGQLDEAEKLYELARKDDPYHTKWIAGLARVHLRQKKTAKFLDDLAMIAANDADDIAVRKALAERSFTTGKTAAAERWATECLHIDVYDPAAHVLLADAQAAGGKFGLAVEEYQTALSLKAKRPDDLKVKLAKAQIGLGQRDSARATLDGILKTDPGHPEAKALREQIDHQAGP
jgi:Tfp pilus assembly protein PilF